MFKKILVLLLAIFLIAGCGKKSSGNTTTFEGYIGGNKTQIVLTYDDQDKLLSQKTVTNFKLPAGMSKEDFQKRVDPVVETLNKIAGINDQVTLKDDVAEEVLTIDYTKVTDWEKLSSLMLGLTSSEKEALTKSKVVSYKLTAEKLIQQGFKEVK